MLVIHHFVKYFTYWFNSISTCTIPNYPLFKLHVLNICCFSSDNFHAYGVWFGWSPRGQGPCYYYGRECPLVLQHYLLHMGLISNGSGQFMFIGVINILLYLNAKAICHNWEKIVNYDISNLPFNYFQFLRYLVIFHIDHLCKYYLQGGAKYINQTYMKICIVSIYRDMQTTDYISRQDPYINTCA